MPFIVWFDLQRTASPVKRLAFLAYMKERVGVEDDPVKAVVQWIQDVECFRARHGASEFRPRAHAAPVVFVGISLSQTEVSVGPMRTDLQRLQVGIDRLVVTSETAIELRHSSLRQITFVGPGRAMKVSLIERQ